ncbi:hypothetical protein G3N18_11830 [Microbacterium sp. 2C]|uniref:hypothetical protein n=1 Tax=Microbacterium paulum TaxID=2707006 RepID=UPI0018C279B7|nr:hypothetical protein [Microbacterium paulum]MBG0718742.1 hypothetical protein [Microbacterium paulum]
MNTYTRDAPAGVTAYDSSVDYAAEDPSRLSRFNISGDIGGYDALDRVDYDDGSQWRVSILDGVVYAVLRRYPGANKYTFTGPLWEIATIPAGYQVGHWPINNVIADFFFTIEQRYRGQPAALLDVVKDVQRWAAELPAQGENRA